MTTDLEIQEKKEIQKTAQFIFNKGRIVHQRIDRIIKSIMLSKDASVINLTLAQMEVIMTIFKVGALSLKDLSGIMKVSPPSTSVMVDKLVEKKFLTRIRSDKDRRKILISVSAEMQQHMEQIEMTVLNMFEELITKVGKDIGEMWCKVLNAVESSLDELPPEPLTTLEN
ncbi:MarR family transcriptional regulator [bacterium]|nr:MarR family transcriptional regulator [bacterium]